MSIFNVYDRYRKMQALNSDVYKSDGRAEFHKYDIRYSKDMQSFLNREIVQDFKTLKMRVHVIHLAAMAGVRLSSSNPELYVDTNINGTINIIKFAESINAHSLTFASSSNVYGDRGSNITIMKEDDVPCPKNIYGITKLAGEHICLSSSIPNVNVLRFFNVIGKNIKPELVMYKFMESVYNKESMTVYGGGSSMRDYTPINDVVKSILHCSTKAEGHNLYNVCSSNPITILDVANSISANMNAKPIIEFQDSRPEDSFYSYGDNTKIKQLGIQFNYSTHKCMEDMCNGFMPYERDAFYR
jgi:UDP-glucuronate 4-epimerase